MSACKHRVMDRCKKDDRPCIFSPDCFEPEEEKPMTNADRIRAMSDEDMAVFLEKIIPMNCDCCVYMRPCRLEYDEETVNYAEKYSCLDGIMRWLQQPSGEEDKHEAV